MAETATDRRTARTRGALRRAFVELLLERGYAALTVDDVVRRADVGRSTFYAHYGGLTRLLRETMDNPSAPLAALVDGAVRPEQLGPLLDHFREQRHRNKVFFAEPVRAMWVARLGELIQPRLGAGTLRLPPELVALQIAEAQIALIVHWLAARPSPPADSVCQALAEVTAALRKALSAP